MLRVEKADRDCLITLYRKRDQHTIGAQQVACDQPVVYFFLLPGINGARRSTNPLYNKWLIQPLKAKCECACSKNF